MKTFIVYTDGGSRGNPGEAAIAAVICNEKGEPLKKIGEHIGTATNNEAEYRAPIMALKKIKSLFGKENTKATQVEFRMDSELVVNQLEGRYKIENSNIQKLFLELWNLKTEFARVTFIAIPRERNKEADRLVNETLDARLNPRRMFS